jgi:hypothetical protein
MAGGAASSAAPTNKARDDMLRAIKVRLFGWPATIRLTPDLSARLTRGIRPWKGGERRLAGIMRPRACAYWPGNRRPRWGSRIWSLTRSNVASSAIDMYPADKCQLIKAQ